MRISVILALLVILSACCEKCPEKSEEPKVDSNTIMRVDLPKDPSPSVGPPNACTVVITMDDRYIIDGNELEFAEIQPYIDDLKLNDPNFDSTLRIEGHRDARYEAVFKVMALCDKLGLKPALAYKAKN